MPNATNLASAAMEPISTAINAAQATATDTTHRESPFDIVDTADRAASLAECRWISVDGVPELVGAKVPDVDITAAVHDIINEWGEAEVEVPCCELPDDYNGREPEGFVRVGAPNVYVLDESGEVVPNARIMVEYMDVDF